MTDSAGKQQRPSGGSPLSAAHVPPAMVESIPNAVVAPVAETGLLPCGVFRSDGSFCEHSRTFLSANRFTDIPAPPPPRGLEVLEGRHLYAGLGRSHFGHFLLESIARLWALDQAHAGVDGIVFTPMKDAGLLAPLMGQYLPFYQAISLGKPFYLADHPLRVGELLVPTQGFGHRNWITGTPEFRAFIRRRLDQGFTPEGPAKLYISRTMLKGDDKRVDQEARIERLMRQAGYTIFHPQLHGTDVQIQHYMAARSLVGTDGSAFHLAAFALRPGTRVALIQRRRRHDVVQAFANQLGAFCDLDLTMIDPTMSRQSSPADPPPAVTPISFRHLKHALAAAGFI